ncbi:sulfite oxidase [Saccharopolyspora rosea]|uniref:sulfite oxidase n=1 Tax=Saccharopolyspora rosea TaxID=524884 RepID=UPI0021DA41F6|nr:sulfite oxidase [Saccharopolyspora rosea]
MWGKRADMTVHEAEPFNAEPPAAVLAEGSVTGTDAFFVRNHGPVPRIEPEQWRLRVTGRVAEPLVLPLAQLRARFPVHEIVATLQCAGNRRAGLMRVRDIPGEAPWGAGATSTAVWTGVRLSDVLDAAGAARDAGHVAFEGTDVSPEATPPQRFGGSIALAAAHRDDVLLAWAMNGAPLPVVHGGPVRVVVPGQVGARSVKWIERITVQDPPSDNYFQARSYRLLPPEADPGEPGAGFALGPVAVNSDILVPDDGAEVPAGPLTVRGYAFAGGDRGVARVDVSTDDGRTWRQAELADPIGPWAWRLWRHRLDVRAGPVEITARAWDTAAGVQPESQAQLWNPKGYANNAWARVRVTATRVSAVDGPGRR